MKLKQIKISNMMSFPYVADMDTMEGIILDNEKNSLNMNILIGPNGSGKSNFIEVIKQFTKNLVLDYSFDKSILSEKKKAKYKKAIVLHPKKTSKLSKNSKFQGERAEIELNIELFENDFENIGFVCKYRERINEILEKYSELEYRFPEFDYREIKEKCRNIGIHAEFSEKEQCFNIERTKLSPEEFFALVCIQEQELLYICIQIFNEFEKKAEERMWYPLKNTFSIISSKRNVDQFNFLTSLKEYDQFVFNEKSNTYEALEGFFKCINKVNSIVNKNSEEILLSTEAIEESIENRIYRSTFWASLSKSIAKFIHKDISIEYVQEGITIKFNNKKGEVYQFENLSSGQQSILLILCAIYGNDLRDGFMIIDEPELHTHPQLQKELAVLLNNISRQYGTQFFLSTYSALFINESNITKVYRFQKDRDNNTKVYNPNLKIASDDAKLVHLLRYENLSKIFFVDKIIMVEGDSDLYFFTNYLKWLQEQPEREDITGTYEIININGKGSYKSWTKFLNKFGIRNYFIGDRDNTVDYGFFTQKELGKYYQIANRHMKNYKGNGGDYYNRLVFVIKKYYPQKFKRIIEGIEDLYQDGVFILKLGAIESYPGLERKGLQYMVNFCNYEFDTWLKDNAYQQQKKELEIIFSNIFNKFSE